MRKLILDKYLRSLQISCSARCKSKASLVEKSPPHNAHSFMNSQSSSNVNSENT